MADAFFHDKEYEKAINHYLALIKEDCGENVKNYSFNRIETATSPWANWKRQLWLITPYQAKARATYKTPYSQWILLHHLLKPRIPLNSANSGVFLAVFL